MGMHLHLLKRGPNNKGPVNGKPPVKGFVKRHRQAINEFAIAVAVGTAIGASVPTKIVPLLEKGYRNIKQGVEEFMDNLPLVDEPSFK